MCDSVVFARKYVRSSSICRRRGVIVVRRLARCRVTLSGSSSRVGTVAVTVVEQVAVTVVEQVRVFLLAVL